MTTKSVLKKIFHNCDKHWETSTFSIGNIEAGKRTCKICDRSEYWKSVKEGRGYWVSRKELEGGW